MESYVRIGGRGLKNLTYPYMGVVGVKNCQNHPYIINEWPLSNIDGYLQKLKLKLEYGYQVEDHIPFSFFVFFPTSWLKVKSLSLTLYCQKTGERLLSGHYRLKKKNSRRQTGWMNNV